MSRRNQLLQAGTGLPLALAAVLFAVAAVAQDQNDETESGAVIEEIFVTGTRIQDPNFIAASPITSIGQEEIELKQTPNIERVFRDLPVTIPGDGENVNNGTAGQATLDLRGLGPERMLVLLDGKRLAPYDINGIVSTDVIPVNMLQRVEVVTGGASAVYGSDAMSGAVNFVPREDFEGVELSYGYSDTDSSHAVGGGGENTTFINALFGFNFDDDRGNFMLGGGHTERGSVLMADREFGIFDVSSSTGDGLGTPPPAPEAGCSGNTDLTVAFSSGAGSTTAIPGTLNLRSGNSYQFRDDGSLVQGECANFNFNPFNYYQTPQDRWQATTVVTYELSESVEAYARASFSSNRSAFQIAPSGTFGASFTIPVMNPFFNDAARQTIINDLNAGAAATVDTWNASIAELQALPSRTPEQEAELAALQARLVSDPLGFSEVGINDHNGDGVFDENDTFTSTARRRTVELGPRTGIFDTDYFQYVIGARGSLPGNFDQWNYDASFQYGESDFVETRDGFTNLTNLQTGINTVDPDQCIDLDGNLTPAPCTPINVFGPLGSITEEQRDDGYFIAIASDLRQATQEIWHASMDGVIDQVSVPWAATGLGVAFGAEFNETTASSSPDECLKLAPASCQGGAGGNRLAVDGKYTSDEYFVEAILPIVQDVRGIENLSLEAGWRTADYDVQGSTDSWKVGASWEIVPGFRFRAMQQQAVRVPNIGELFRPIVTALDNATFDPCSVGNPNPPQPGSEMFNRCVQTGMLGSQVGQVPDIISGQVNIFFGTNPEVQLIPEEADTRTVGFVWDMEVPGLGPANFSLDYYDIEINDYIDTPSGQESLDLCYVLGEPSFCNGIVRIGGALTVSGTGTPSYFTNFTVFEAAGIDFQANLLGFDVGNLGTFGASLIAHKYLTNEFQTTVASPVVDCKGRYGTSCDPVPEFRSTLRLNWSRKDFDGSLLWRHIGSMDAQENEADSLFEGFRSIDAHNYFDLNFGYNYNDFLRFSLLVANVTDEEPPIIGNSTGSTAFNSGNTFPSLFDTMGRIYTASVKFSFR